MYRPIKRILDIVLSLAGLAVLWLPMLIIALAVKLDSPGPALFKQKRVGIHKIAEVAVLDHHTLRRTCRA